MPRRLGDFPEPPLSNAHVRSVRSPRWPYLIGRMPSDSDRAELLVDGQRILPDLLADLDAAEREVHFSMFLFFRDPIGDEVGDALIRAAGRGVEVRVLLNV